MERLQRVNNGGSAICEKPKRMLPYWLLLAGFALLTLTAVSCGTSAEQSAGVPEGSGEQAVVDLGHPSLGNEDAPVVLIEYADFQ